MAKMKKKKKRDLWFVAVSCYGWARTGDSATALRKAREYGFAGRHAVWVIDEGEDFELNPGQLMITGKGAFKLGEFLVDEDDVITVSPPEDWLNPPRGDLEAWKADRRAAAQRNGLLTFDNFGGLDSA